jgi:hypothetical protein
MKRLLAMVMLVLAAAHLASGQQQPAPPPKPGPEVQRLGSLIGTWKTDAGEKVTYKWFDGGFSVIGHVENSGPDGKSTELRIITYDPDVKTYSQYRITSTGPGGTLGRGGTVSGNTWVWPVVDDAECGKSAKCRFTIVEDTPTSFHAKLEVSKGVGPWTVTFATKGVKIK